MSNGNTDGENTQDGDAAASPADLEEFKVAVKRLLQSVEESQRVIDPRLAVTAAKLDERTRTLRGLSEEVDKLLASTDAVPKSKLVEYRAHVEGLARRMEGVNAVLATFSASFRESHERVRIFHRSSIAVGVMSGALGLVAFSATAQSGVDRSLAIVCIAAALVTFSMSLLIQRMALSARRSLEQVELYVDRAAVIGEVSSEPGPLDAPVTT